MSTPAPKNPFYALVFLAGGLFAITAFAYGIVAANDLAQVAPSAYSDDAESRHRDGFKKLVNRHGLTLMGVELAALAIGTVGAIWLDAHRQRIADDRKNQENIK